MLEKNLPGQATVLYVMYVRNRDQHCVWYVALLYMCEVCGIGQRSVREKPTWTGHCTVCNLCVRNRDHHCVWYVALLYRCEVYGIGVRSVREKKKTRTSQCTACNRCEVCDIGVRSVRKKHPGQATVLHLIYV